MLALADVRAAVSSSIQSERVETVPSRARAAFTLSPSAGDCSVMKLRDVASASVALGTRPTGSSRVAPPAI
ncbi:hypothetical protein SAZ11_47650 [Streptomyces sp. FXJ1.4098]|nr:hypothetical protein [Streptomyces sp. FXJ1.4098]